MTRYEPGTYFSAGLVETDAEVASALASEWKRQRDGIELIASENHVSRATLDALASPIVNKTVEGYPGDRYYGGAEHADVIEQLAIGRACHLFGAAHANVQPHSGSQANLAVLLAFLKPGDTILSMDLSAGGHLSHGSKANLSGKWMNIVHYGVDAATGRIDMDQVADLAAAHRPKLIIAGGSAYPRTIDFEQFAAIATSIDATFLVDMAHFAGLVAAGVHPDPVPHADVVTTTTYKSLRGVRGGIVLTKHASLARTLDRAVFPGVQGSVMLNLVAAKAVCLAEAARPEFRVYAAQVLDNSRALASSLVEAGAVVVTGGTDTPIVLVDIRGRAFTGKDLQDQLDEVGLTVNKNGVPGDERGPRETSGIRLGSSAGTARGLGRDDFAQIGRWIADIIGVMSTDGDVDAVARRVETGVAELTAAYPMDGAVD